MPDSQDDNQDTRIPYEPPRLFDLGGGVAYAQEGGTTCQMGSVADNCKEGCIAIKGKPGKKCKGKK